ncbi:calcium-binding protein [Rhizorhabdus phycosphaerae]|uniref:calcium-binding protein n=1 Tax=Rhizorhabdus phycosphaerae TaxID=2711156 RepID=UPI0013EA48D9|nr:calcium-binding protein [Rhizorhabdus phycosphaerae]
MTSADAANLVAGDVLTFSSSTLTPADVVVANSGNAFDITTLTAGGKSLSFPGAALSDANIQFVSSFIAGSGATLVVGTNGADQGPGGVLELGTDDDGSYIYGFAGNDVIDSTGSGAVTILGGDGNDLIFSAGGGSIDGGAGDDEIDSDTDDTIVIVGGAGDDQIDIQGSPEATITAGAGDDSVQVDSDSEGLLNITLGDGNDVFEGNGSDSTSIVEGGAGADVIEGGDGNDRLYGQSAAGGADGNDTISGGEGSDYLQGNAGSDTLDGGRGSDRIFGGADNDTIRGDDGNDTVNGNKGEDLIDGGDGNDSLRGGADDDIIWGGFAGENALLVGSGNDVILGDAGDDTLIGGAGNDTIDILTGGAGNDVFVFESGDAAIATIGDDTLTDRITDFTTGDKIDIGHEVTDVTSAPGLIFTTVEAAFNYANDAEVAEGEVLALTVGTDTYLFYNAANDEGSVDSAIALTGVTTVTTASFVAADFFDVADAFGFAIIS